MSFMHTHQESYDGKEEFLELVQEFDKMVLGDDVDASPRCFPSDNSPQIHSGDTSWCNSGDASPQMSSGDNSIASEEIPVLMRKDLTKGKGSFVGSGAFANTHKGSLRLPDGSQATVAIKEFFSDPESLGMLRQEACMLRDVAGIAGAPRLYGVITHQEPLTLVMEFCEGQTYRPFVRKADISDSFLTLQMIERSVEDLHRAGFAHCDLHGSNIIVDNTSALTVRFIDFGLAEKLSNIEEDDEFYIEMDKHCLSRLAALIPQQ